MTRFLTAYTCSIVYSISVAFDGTWVLSVGSDCIDIKRCQFLNSIPTILSSVDHVTSLLKLLDQSTLCSGNPDSKFINLIHQQKGVFKNYNG